MTGKILEISNRVIKGGKVPIKMALLKIHEDNSDETNYNGLHWVEEYVKNNIDSASNMPICASFVDENKTVPFDHGLTGTMTDENGFASPVYENSEVVGVIDHATIEEISVNETQIKALVGEGYLYNQRYPNFVQWVRENNAIGNVESSIEIVGTPENENCITYVEAEPKQEKRTPKDFLFSGTAILSVSAADSDAIVLEIAQKKGKEEQKDMEPKEIMDLVTSTIAECNNHDAEYDKQISELNSTIEAKNAELSEKDGKIAELNATIEEVQKALEECKKEQEGLWAERDELEKQLGKLKAEARIGELNEKLADFSDEEKEYARAEINSFNEKPMDGDIDAIVGKIYVGIGEAAKKQAAEAKVAEQNAKQEEGKPEVVDIFSEMCEGNASEEEEDVSIF